MLHGSSIVQFTLPNYTATHFSLDYYFHFMLFLSVIMELEVSNRNIAQMRNDYFDYYQEPTVHAVVCIKMLPGDDVDKLTHRARSSMLQVVFAVDEILQTVT